MKIEIGYPVSPTTVVSRFTPGEIFIYPVDGNDQVFLMTDLKGVERPTILAAVNLSNGNVKKFDIDQEVFFASYEELKVSTSKIIDK